MGMWCHFIYEVTEAERGLRNCLQSQESWQRELGSDPGSLAPEPQHIASRPIQKLRDDYTIFSFLFSTVSSMSRAGICRASVKITE